MEANCGWKRNAERFPLAHEWILFYNQRERLIERNGINDERTCQ
jgi:hypothetical protein